MLRDERQRALDAARAEADALAGGVVPRKHRLQRAELAEAVHDAEVAIEHARRSHAGAVAAWRAAEAAASDHLADEAEASMLALVAEARPLVARGLRRLPRPSNWRRVDPRPAGRRRSHARRPGRWPHGPALDRVAAARPRRGQQYVVGNQ